MRPQREREQAIQMRASGVPFGEICSALGLPKRTVTHWFAGTRRSGTGRWYPSNCPRCAVPPAVPTDLESYAYLLGLYLGDGHILAKPRVYLLQISCTAAYPAIIDECERAMVATLGRRTHRTRRSGCVNVKSCGKHWLCLFPQHGPGKKHERTIVLDDWQRRIVEQRPGAFLRGLFHSDGCRIVNRVKIKHQTYEYPRYMFSNKSTDIMGLCQWALDLLGIPWRMARPDNLSVARREAVAALDVWVGPKS